MFVSDGRGYRVAAVAWPARDAVVPAVDPGALRWDFQGCLVRVLGFIDKIHDKIPNKLLIRAPL